MGSTARDFFVGRLSLIGRTATLRQGQNPHHQDLAGARYGQHIARANRLRGFLVDP